MPESLGFVLTSNQCLGIQVLGAIGAIIGPTGSLSEICRLQLESRTFRCIERCWKIDQALQQVVDQENASLPLLNPHTLLSIVEAWNWRQPQLGIAGPPASSFADLSILLHLG
jgi:hypothetical protein